MQLFHAEPAPAVETLLTSKQLAALSATPTNAAQGVRDTAVGEQGASIFVSALRRVATINNIPISPSSQAGPGFWNHVTYHADALLDLANNWLHGSIASRLDYVEHLGTDPRLTGHFDRMMFWVYGVLLAALMLSLGASMAMGSM